MLKQLLSFTAILVLATCFSAQAMIITLSPAGGALSGTPGSTVGWGYTVTNDSLTDWIVLSSSTFDTPASWGTYIDFVPSNFILLAPSGSIGDSDTKSFDPFLLTGFGRFNIDPSAVPGSIATGRIVLSFDRFDGDPGNGGNPIPGIFTEFADASVTVNTPTPEPGTMLLLGAGLMALLPFRRRILGMRG